MVRGGQVDGDYEVAIDGLLGTHVFTMASTAGLPWIEIDFPQDLHAAETEMLPRIGRLAARVTLAEPGQDTAAAARARGPAATSSARMAIRRSASSS